MKKILVLLLVLTVVAAFVGCTEKSDRDDGTLSVVVTAFPHYDFVRQITKGVENVEIKMLISPGNEVHTYEPGPSDILALSECDVFVYTGGESDTWVKNILSSAKNEDMRVVSFMDLCRDSIEKFEKEHGDEHEHVYDEHVWTSPSMAVYLAHAIKNTLIGIDEKNTDKYIRNGDEFEEKIREVENAFGDVMNSRIRDYIIVADRFPFYHLAEAFEIEYLSAYPGCSSATEPSAAVVAELSERVKNENVPYVFTIEFSNQKIANNVISGTDAQILTLHSCHNVTAEDFENGITYVDLMHRNAENLRKAMCE